MEQVANRKRMLEQEEEARKEGKLQEYFQKLEKMQSNKLSHVMSLGDSVNLDGS